MGDVGVGGGRGEAPGDPANEGQEGKKLERLGGLGACLEVV